MHALTFSGPIKGRKQTKVKREERIPTRCNNIDDLLSVSDVELLTTVSTCFGHLYAHHQEKRPRVTVYGVYLLVVLDVAGCGSAVLCCGV